MVSLNSHDRGSHHTLHVAEYMFKMTCMAQNIDPFCKYMNTISGIIWNIEMEDEDASDRDRHLKEITGTSNTNITFFHFPNMFPYISVCCVTLL